MNKNELLNSDFLKQFKDSKNFGIMDDLYKQGTSIVYKISNDIIAWQNRSLESTYFLVCMNANVFKVRENSMLVNKSIYLAVGLRKWLKKCQNKEWQVKMIY